MGFITMMYDTLKCFGEGRKKGCAINKTLVCHQRHTDDGCVGVTAHTSPQANPLLGGSCSGRSQGHSEEEAIWQWLPSTRSKPATLGASKGAGTTRHKLAACVAFSAVGQHKCFCFRGIFESGLIYSCPPSGFPANSNWSIHRLLLLESFPTVTSLNMPPTGFFF